MNSSPKVLFFGSGEDSLTILNSFFAAHYNIIGVVTQPPKPVGRKKIVTPTPTEVWGNKNQITVVHFTSNPQKPWLYLDESKVINTLSTFSADLLISASYGLKIPTETINSARFGGLNVHPSLLPRFRGADPIPWTILAGDHQAGATVVTLTEKMDQGKIIAQQKISLAKDATHIPVRKQLFELGSQLLLTILPSYLDGSIKGGIQNQLEATTARRLKKVDGFVPWDLVLSALKGTKNELTIQKIDLFNSISMHTTHYSQPSIPSPAVFLDRMLRALIPWPGVFTKLNIKGEEKILKILSGNLEPVNDDFLFVLKEVQLEGKTPVAFDQFSKAYNI